MQYNFKIPEYLSKFQIGNIVDLNKQIDYNVSTNNAKIKEKIDNILSREMYFLFCEFIEGKGRFYTKNITLDLILEFFYMIERYNIILDDPNILEIFSKNICLFFKIVEDDKILSKIKINIKRFLYNVLLFFNEQHNLDFMKYSQFKNEDILNDLSKNINVFSNLDKFQLQDKFRNRFKKDEYNKNVFPIGIDGSLKPIYFLNVVNEKNPFNKNEISYYNPIYLNLVGEEHIYSEIFNNINTYLLLDFNIAEKMKNPIVYYFEYINFEYEQYQKERKSYKSSLVTFSICNNKYENIPDLNKDFYCKRNIYYVPTDYRLYNRKYIDEDILENIRKIFYIDIQLYPNLGDIIDSITSPESICDDMNLCFLYLFGYRESSLFLQNLMDEKIFNQPYNSNKYYNILYNNNNKYSTYYFNFARKFIFIDDFITNVRKQYYINTYNFNLIDTYNYNFNQDEKYYFKFSDFLQMIPLSDNECKSRLYWSIVKDYLLKGIDRTNEIGMNLNYINKSKEQLKSKFNIDNIFYYFIEYKFGYLYYCLILHNNYIKTDNIFYKLSDSIVDLFIVNPIIFDRILSYFFNLFDNSSYIHSLYYNFNNLFEEYNGNISINYNNQTNNPLKLVSVYEKVFLLDLNFYSRLFINSNSISSINNNFSDVNEKNIVFMGDTHITNIHYFIINYLSDLVYIKDFTINKEFIGEIELKKMIPNLPYLNKNFPSFFDNFNKYKYNKNNYEMDILYRKSIYNTVKILKNEDLTNIKPLIENKYQLENKNVFENIESRLKNEDNINQQSFNNYYFYFKLILFLLLDDVINSQEMEYLLNQLEYNFLIFEILIFNSNTNRILKDIEYISIINNLKYKLYKYYENYYIELNIIESSFKFEENNNNIKRVRKAGYEYQFISKNKFSQNIIDKYNNLDIKIKEIFGYFCNNFLRSNIYFDPRYYNMRIINFIKNKVDILYKNENYLVNINFLLNMSYELQIQPNEFNNLFYNTNEKMILTGKNLI